MFFGAVENFERALLQTHTDRSTLILRLHAVPFMDITGLQTLQAVIGKLRQRGIRVLLCEANARVLTKLRNARVLEPSGRATAVPPCARPWHGQALLPISRRKAGVLDRGCWWVLEMLT